MSARHCGSSIVGSLAGERKGIKKSLRSSRYRKEEVSFFVFPLKGIAKSRKLTRSEITESLFQINYHLRIFLFS
jgi:hypothetical protein